MNNRSALRLRVPLLALLLISATQAFAQSPPSRSPTPAPAQPAPTDPKACAPGERLPLQDGSSKEPVTTGEALSDKLARTDGVICPPHIDPEIKLPTPPGGTIQIIPAPGSPGGDPSVRPK
jgi:hypothetical protein